MLLRSMLAASLMAALSTAWASAPVLPSATQKSVGLDWIDRISVPAADVRGLAGQDDKAVGRPMRVGIVQRVDRSLVGAGEASAGSWTQLDDGRLLWALDVASEGAVWLDLHFSRFQLPEGAELYLSDAQGQYVLGPIRGSDALADGSYYTALIPGDQLRMEVTVNAEQRAGIDLFLSGVNYGYRGILGLDDHPDAIRSGACNIDVACPLGDTWGDQIDSVGQYIFTSGGTSYVCTGSLIANTGGTPIPYFLTANHCVSTTSEANSMRVYWNYQSPTCRTPGSAASGSSLPRPATFNNGATLRMNYSTSDTSLVELNAPVPLAEDPFFVGWDRRNLATPGNPQVSDAVSIHHPSGHEKRITKDNDSLTVTTYLSNTATPTGSHYRIGNWEHGTTEGGSSGSALFSPDGYLIGTLHGGYASCASNTQDWYGRIYQAWTGGGTNASRLSNWLDPQGTAPEIFAGYRGAPQDVSDLSVNIVATPNPVDIGDPTTLAVEVANAGPDDADGVRVEVALPTGIEYVAFNGAGWSCSHTAGTVTCDLGGSLASGDDASVEIDTTVSSGALPGTVEVTAQVSSDNADPVPGNNQDALDIDITGTPDVIFQSDFECANGLPDCAMVDPDIVDSGAVNISVPASVGLNGFSINWVTGATCNCDDETGYHFNPYGQSGNLLAFWFYPNDDTLDRAGMVVNGQYAVLDSGATVGPASNFQSVGGEQMATMMADWRAGANGYLGVRFTNPTTSQLNYGYVELNTTAGGGFPMTIVRYWYNSAGNAITIP